MNGFHKVAIFWFASQELAGDRAAELPAGWKPFGVIEGGLERGRVGIVARYWINLEGAE